MTWGYTGTLDKIVRINDKIGLIDLKTGQSKKADRYQIAGYQVAYEEMTRTKLSFKWCVYLRTDGTYKIEPHTNRNDKQNWLSIMCVYNLKHGGTLK